MERVYLVFTRSKSIVSTAVFLFTKAKFTHVSISFDEKLEYMYSFGRRLPLVNLPAGLVKEHLDQGFYAVYKKIPCEVYSMECTAESRDKAEEIIETMFRERLKYKFSAIGLVLCRLNIAQKRPYRYFCSQFVSEVLQDSGICTLEKDPSLIQPMDLYRRNDIKFITRGTVSQVSSQMKSIN